MYVLETPQMLLDMHEKSRLKMFRVDPSVLVFQRIPRLRKKALAGITCLRYNSDIITIEDIDSMYCSIPPFEMFFSE